MHRVSSYQVRNSTLCLVYSTRCRPGLTHVADILLQLSQCTSGQVAGPQVSWDVTYYGLTDVPVAKSERLAFGQSIPSIVLFSWIWARHIWPKIEYVDAILGFHTELLSSWVARSEICSSSLDLVMDRTHQEKEILRFSGLTNWKQWAF